MNANAGRRFWEDRWRILAWLAPAAILVLMLRFSILPLAERLRDVRAQVTALRQNRYEPAWLDSTQSALQGDVDALAAFRKSRESFLNGDSAMQAAVDRIRGLAQASGVEVLRTTPVLAKADSLRVLRVRIEGLAQYAGLRRFLGEMHARHPDLFPEEVGIRQGSDRTQGKMAAALTISIYSRIRKGDT